MKLQDFAKERQVKSEAVAQYIRRHKDEYDGHTRRIDNALELDEVAVELLNKKYPLPQPIEVIIDHESRDKLIKAQDVIISLQQQIMLQTERLSEIELEHARAQLQLEDKEGKIKELQAEIERLRNRTFWERLRNL